jgi:drug/metabolite transporter (DMT)-like permease
MTLETAKALSNRRDSMYILKGIRSLTQSNKAVFWMMLGGFDFATMGALIHALGSQCDWLLLAFFRMLLSFVISFMLTQRAGLTLFLVNRPLLWLRSFVGCSAMIATIYALTKLPISDVAVITESRPIWVAFLAGFILGETTGRRTWLSIILGMTGVILVEQAHFTDEGIAGPVALFAAFGGAIVMILLRKLRDVDPRVIVTHFTGTATVVCLILIFALGKKINLSFMDKPANILMLTGVGVFGTIGQLAMTKAFSLGEAPSVASAGFVRVGFSAAYDILIWQRMFQLATLLGVALILGSTGGLLKPAQRPAELETLVGENVQKIGVG